MRRWIRRVAALDPADRRLVVEAAILLLVARLGIRVWSVPTLRRVLGRLPLPLGRAGTASVERIGWAVEAASRYLGPTTCLMDALTAHAMLARRGQPATLRLGVRRPVDHPGRLTSHAWVECHGRIIVGETEGLADYEVLVPPGPAP